MKVLVTGSEGFIGKVLCRHLKNLDYRIFEYDIKNNYDYGNQWFDHHYDIIYHLGAVSDTREKDANLIYERNIIFTQRLIEHANRNNSFISFASSASVYGKGKFGEEFRVGDPVNPDSLYAKSKVAGEMMLELSGVKHNCLRFFNVYSDNLYDEAHKVGYSSPHHAFLKQNPIKIFEGSDKIYRDFIHVDYVIKHIMMNSFYEGTFNVGTGYPTSFLEVAEYISRITKAPIEYIPFPEELKNTYQYYTKAGL